MPGTLTSSWPMATDCPVPGFATMAAVTSAGERLGAGGARWGPRWRHDLDLRLAAARITGAHRLDPDRAGDLPVEVRHDLQERPVQADGEGGRCNTHDECAEHHRGSAGVRDAGRDPEASRQPDRQREADPAQSSPIGAQ